VKLIHLSKHKEAILVCSVGRQKVLEVSIEGLCCGGQKNGIEGPDIFSRNNGCCQLIFVE
jgi:hypothetical protein